MQRAIEQWLPHAELAEVDVCPYDNSVDERFILERIDGIVVGAGTSGHAFKFASQIGRLLSELALNGKSTIDLTPFALDRPILKLKDPPKNYMQ